MYMYASLCIKQITLEVPEVYVVLKNFPVFLYRNKKYLFYHIQGPVTMGHTTTQKYIILAIHFRCFTLLNISSNETF